MNLPLVSRARFDDVILERGKLEAKTIALSDQAAHLREELARCQAYLEKSNDEALNSKLAYSEIKAELVKEREHIDMLEAQIDDFEKTLKAPAGADSVISINGRPTLKGIAAAATQAAKKRAKEGGESLAVEVANDLMGALLKGRKDAKVG